MPGERRHDLWQRAAAFAARAHRHQKRKDGKTPYVSHVYRVAMTVRHVFGVEDEVILAAAMLHDTIEDTDVDFDELEKAFGREVATLAALLTKDMRLPELKREKAYDEQLRRGPWAARLLKLADVYDNYTDSRTPKERAKMRAKARRAIALAEGDKRLDKARKAVETLIRSR